jgi:methyltransferase-like protein
MHLEHADKQVSVPMNAAVGQLKSAYDEVPYTSHPFPLTAPENLAAVAHLFGLEAPPVATARVLELGCSSAGNLIPFAARTTDAQILGIDLSGVQIDIGRKRIEALGLSNIELREADLSALDAEKLGTFDYIICHGVYSWVPPHVQDAILRICKEHLALKGVAYVSYNVYPGWKAKEIVRDAMMLRGGARATAAERLSYAKGMLDFLEQVAPTDSMLSKTLEATLSEMRRQQDYYIAHEYLEPFNSPCYFQDFVERANGHGLAYLAEAQPATMFASNYGERVAGPLLKECGHSQVVLEQYLDFIVNRTFRQTLLVHRDREEAVGYRLRPERLRNLHFAATMPPLDGETRLDDTSQSYGTADANLTAQRSEAKAALDVLSAAWPETLSYEELLRRTSERCKSTGRDVSVATVERLLETLVIKGWARMRLSPVTVDRHDDFISIDKIVRQTAELSRKEGTAMAFNAWHEPVPLGIVDAWLLPELDGSKDRAALIATLERHVAEGNIAFERQGSRVVESGEVRECIAEHVGTIAARLAAQKLLKLVAEKV